MPFTIHLHRRFPVPCSVATTKLFGILVIDHTPSAEP